MYPQRRPPRTLWFRLPLPSADRPSEQPEFRGDLGNVVKKSTQAQRQARYRGCALSRAALPGTGREVPTLSPRPNCQMILTPRESNKTGEPLRRLQNKMRERRGAWRTESAQINGKHPDTLKNSHSFIPQDPAQLCQGLQATQFLLQPQPKYKIASLLSRLRVRTRNYFSKSLAHYKL